MTTDQRNTETLEAFAARSYATLIRYVRTKAPDTEAQDIVQDSLTVLVEKRDTIENYEAFLFKVVCNKLKQFYERRARKAGIVGVVWTSGLMPVAVLSTRLSIRVARQNDLEAAMQQLPLRQYQAFELRYIEGLKISEAADALDISEATLKRDIDGARKALASVLGDAGEANLARIVRSYIKG